MKLEFFNILSSYNRFGVGMANVTLRYVTLRNLRCNLHEFNVMLHLYIYQHYIDLTSITYFNLPNLKFIIVLTRFLFRKKTFHTSIFIIH